MSFCLLVVATVFVARVILNFTIVKLFLAFLYSHIFFFASISFLLFSPRRGGEKTLVTFFFFFLQVALQSIY